MLSLEAFPHSWEILSGVEMNLFLEISEVGTTSKSWDVSFQPGQNSFQSGVMRGNLWKNGALFWDKGIEPHFYTGSPLFPGFVDKTTQHMPHCKMWCPLWHLPLPPSFLSPKPAASYFRAANVCGSQSILLVYLNFYLYIDFCTVHTYCARESSQIFINYCLIL